MQAEKAETIVPWTLDRPPPSAITPFPPDALCVFAGGPDGSPALSRCALHYFCKTATRSDKAGGTVKVEVSSAGDTVRCRVEDGNLFNFLKTIRERRRMPDQTRLVIVGATGMVGSYALRYALEHAAVSRVTAIGRRPIGLAHAKLKEVVHRDFGDCSALAQTLSDQDAVAFCLGVYTGAVPDAQLRTITVDYTIGFAGVLYGSSPRAALSFLSGSGADPTGRSRMPFARYKGEAEKALLSIGFPHVYLFRPAYIYPVVPREEPNWSYRLLRTIYPAFRVVFPNQVIRADDLAQCMVDVAIERTHGRSAVFENRDIRALVESRDH